MFSQKNILIYSLFTCIISSIVYILWLPCQDFYTSNQLCNQPVSYKFRDDQLTCNDLDEIDKISLIGEGAVKRVYLAKWKTDLIVLSQLKNSQFQNDFNHNLKMLKSLKQSGRVVKLIGSCNNTIIFTQFHPFGNPLNLLIWKQLWPHSILHNQIDCFKLCLSYVELIVFLHNNSLGPLVMCDSNSLEKLLSQLLLDFDDQFGLRLIANDLDALPKVNKNGIKCGPRQIFGNFAAPEQLWPYSDKPFNNFEMPHYNEKIDIWKLPDVCEWFINLCHGTKSDQITKQLQSLHQKCKSQNPHLRPNASYIHQVYIDVYKNLINR